MRDDITPAIRRLLTQDVIDRMAASHGLDHWSAWKAAKLGVPEILDAFDELQESRTGDDLKCAVRRQLSNPVERLPAPSDGKPRVQGNGHPLTELIGEERTAALASAVAAESAGAPEGRVYEFLNALTPAILWVIGQEGRKAGMGDAGIAAALAPRERRNASPPPLPPPSRPASAAYVAQPQSLSIGHIYRALPLVVLAGAACFFLSADMGGNSHVVIAAEPEAAPAKVVRAAATESPSPIDLPSAGAYRGRDVYNRAGEKIGTVTDVVADPEGQPAAALVSIGRSLGIGEDNVAMPIAALQYVRRDDGDVRLLVEHAASPNDPTAHRRFAAPGLKDAIPATVPAPVEKPAALEARAEPDAR